MNERRSPQMEQLRHAITETCFDARKYAADSLALSTIHVSVDECHYPFTDSLPQDIQDGFTSIGKPAKNVVSIDLNLAYDKAEMLFSPNEVALKLDNQYTIQYGRLSQSNPQSALSHFFYPFLLNPEGRSAVAQEKTPLVLEDVVYEFLTELGVNIPTTPQRADWDAIDDILQFSNRWTAVSENSRMIDPVRSVRVENRVDAVGMINPEAFDDDEIDAADADSGARVSEIVVAIEDAANIGERPYTALQFVQRSDDELSFHRFVGIQRVPIAYEYDHELLPYRLPYPEAQAVLPNVGILELIRGAIRRASELVD